LNFDVFEMPRIVTHYWGVTHYWVKYVSIIVKIIKWFVLLYKIKKIER